jgi:hypothetical protein
MQMKFNLQFLQLKAIKIEKVVLMTTWEALGYMMHDKKISV